MRAYLKLIAKIFIFWLVFFTVQQVLFLAFNFGHWKAVSFSHVMASFLHSISMNISAISYLLALPFLLIHIFGLMRKDKWIGPFVYAFMMILSIINLIICTADIGLFNAWSSKINSKALYYLLFPDTAVATVEGGYNYMLVGLLVVEIIIVVIILNRLFKNKPVVIKIHWAMRILAFMLTAGTLFLGIRGGTQTYPISRSWVYYSKYPVLNSAAMNGFWNFINVLFYMESKQNPYSFFDNKTAVHHVNKMFDPDGPKQISVIKTERPNIVLILLESWSADAVECLGGEKGITPGFDSLAEDGILFTGFYSSGFRTEQGFVAIICGFPAQPQTTIIRKFGKFEHLPGLIKILAEHQYQSSYYYSGNLEFANTEAFLKVSGFDLIYGEKNFPVKRRTRWGAYDEELFDFHAKDSRHLKEPFISVIMTSTSHEPFNGDVAAIRKPVDEPSRYLNTVHYTDSCLYNYFRKAKHEPWYKNTLFIITADHGHYNPYNRSYNSPERHRIPLLLYGDVIREEFRGLDLAVTGYHPDIPVTLFGQLGITGHNFDWGNDLFRDSIPHYAFYTFDNGFGILQDTSFLVYDHNQQKVIQSKGSRIQQDDLTLKGKAFLQLIVQKYIDLDN